MTTHGLHPPKSNWALPVDEPPFHAYPIISANVFTFGGVKVDSSARVLNMDGDPILGLYAAGEIIGTYYRHYTGATSVLKGLVFGSPGRDGCRQTPGQRRMTAGPRLYRPKTKDPFGRFPLFLRNGSVHSCMTGAGRTPTREDATMQSLMVSSMRRSMAASLR